MANLGQKDGVYHVRFRYRGKEYKKSLKIRDESTVTAARNLVELTIHRLMTGQITVPLDVDPVDFIVSGGILLQLDVLYDLIVRNGMIVDGRGRSGP